MSILNWDRYCDDCEANDLDPEEAFFTAEVEICNGSVVQVFKATCDRCGCEVSETDVRSAHMEQLEQERADAKEWNELGRFGF
jgi:hypothetical protein